MDESDQYNKQSTEIIRGKAVPLYVTQFLTGAIGMAGTIGFGLGTGRMGLGLLASFGAMVMSGTASEGTTRQRISEMMKTVVVGITAMVAGSIIGGHGWLTAGLIIVIAVSTALLGGMSRPAARAGSQFIIFTMIGSSFGGGRFQQHPMVLASGFALGCLWTMLVSMVVSCLFPKSVQRLDASTALKADISFRDRMRWWRRSLRHIAGWQYTFRMALCMTAAEILGQLLHQERAYWIALTVAIVLQRDLSSAYSRIVKRGAGTIAGVIAGSLLLLWPAPQYVSLIMIGIMGALRPVFKNRNYIVYTALMTPLMLLMFSLDSKITGHLLLERVVDTLIGCAISMIFGYFLWKGRKPLIQQP